MDPKHPLRPLTGKLPKGGHESFQMRYYMTLYVKGLQNCRPSKLGPAGYRTRAWRLVYKIGEKRSLEPKISAFFLTANFDGLQLCSPLTYKEV